jgi:diguanylate cyclase (GGDEF)-like protein
MQLLKPMEFFKSPLVRISFGLVVVTISALLLSDLLGLVPDTKRAKFNSRKVIAESLAVQFSMVISNDQLDSVQETLRLLVERNEDVQSAAIRRKSAGLIAEFGGHRQYWTLEPDDRSTPNQIQVPLFDIGGIWGTVELSFVDVAASNEGIFLNNSFPGVIALVALCGFFGYWIFLKRALQELDPSSVIPERVRVALDTLSEGLIIVNQDNAIVFSNLAFADKAGMTPNDLVGKPCQSLPWDLELANCNEGELPWDEVLLGNDMISSDVATIGLSAGLDKQYKFVLNASPILSAEGDVRGALITFDDVTEMERQNVELQDALLKLEQGQRKITRQNQELHVLATRDPLTNLLNRRSFVDSFDSMITDAFDDNLQLACLMLDIDHFKSVNDEFGHPVGDKVIKALTAVLTEVSRPDDIVGRYGGEEFCIALPAADSVLAFGVAEQIRMTLQKIRIEELGDKRSITASIGVTDLSQGAKDVAEMIDQSDKALYAAKENGRDRVIRWPMDLNKDTGAALRAQAKARLAASRQKGSAAADNQPSTRQAYRQKLEVDAPERAGPVSAEKAKTPAEAGADSEQSNVSRALLVDRINQAILRSARYKTTIAVLALEFDVTQRVEDEELGFSMAYKLERAVTQRLREGLRSTDTVSIDEEEDELLYSVLRTGVREVVILLTDLEQPEIVSLVLSRLFAVAKAPIVADGIEFFMDADIGVSIYPLDSEDANSLLSYAKSAVREAKKSAGNNNWQFYSEDVNASSKRLRRMESELQLALGRGELGVHYQPKVCLKRGTIVGAEVLLRWEHPELGLVSPADFVALAEQSDLIDKITMRLISTACTQVNAWKEAGYKNLTVSVNLSPVQFRNGEIAEQIIAQVNESEISPQSIEFEITENVVVENMQTAINTLDQLSTAGFTITIDDFGVGYSTFGYLKNFPVNGVKIDKSFIADLALEPTAAPIVSTIIAMAHSLRLNVVAEGVETEDQLRFLQDFGCDQAQGYLICKPLPAQKLSKLLAKPGTIKRLILDHVKAGETSQESSTSMFGIINEFDAETIEPPKLVVSNPDIPETGQSSPKTAQEKV